MKRFIKVFDAFKFSVYYFYFFTVNVAECFRFKYKNPIFVVASNGMEWTINAIKKEIKGNAA